ncbi:hypothetical protein FOMPIDRAFT_1014927 [Fomitopsis schrenkii]|uniref:Uncharacterized protein n=1 Tax=Fomitopsis schrenkii TaxID=2126942 RepID=S8EEH1_FOMSC|nr:hypothetical protein FOMPIDRAFT_1014927 [Fomitopsis schrenkii]
MSMSSCGCLRPRDSLACGLNLWCASGLFAPRGTHTCYPTMPLRNVYIGFEGGRPPLLTRVSSQRKSAHRVITLIFVYPSPNNYLLNLYQYGFDRRPLGHAAASAFGKTMTSASIEGTKTQDGHVMVDWQRQKQTKQPALKKKSSHEKLIIQSFDPNDPEASTKLEKDWLNKTT